MQNLITSLKREYFPIGLIVILALSRLIPHPDNFTPIIAIAIMGSYFFNNINLSYLVVLFSMLIADFFIGFYGHVLFVYLPLFLIILVFFKLSKKINFKNLFIFGFTGSLIFFIIGLSFTFLSIQYYTEIGRINANITIIAAGTTLIAVVLLITSILLYSLVSVVRENK